MTTNTEKTVRCGDTIRGLNHKGVLCQTRCNQVSLIVMYNIFGDNPFPNRWNEPVKVSNINRITKQELKYILGEHNLISKFEIKVGKRYVNLEKYLNTP